MRRKYTLIDLLRFAASIFVMMYHTPIERVKDVLPLIARNGHIWVYFFLIVSGFFSALGYKEKIEPIHFVKQKAKKLYPLYFIGLMITFIIFVKVLKPVDIITTLTLTQTWALRYLPFSDPGWYLSALMFLYFCFPIIYESIKNDKYKALIFNIILILYSYFLINKLSEINNSYNGNLATITYMTRYFPPFMLGVYTCGITIFLFTNGMKQNSYYSPLIILYSTIITVFLNTTNYFINTLVFIPLIFMIALDNGILSKLTCNKFVLYLSSLSYPIYILHIPIKYIFIHFDSSYFIGGKRITFYYLFVILCSVLYVFLRSKLIKTID